MKRKREETVKAEECEGDKDKVRTPLAPVALAMRCRQRPQKPTTNQNGFPSLFVKRIQKHGKEFGAPPPLLILLLHSSSSSSSNNKKNIKETPLSTPSKCDFINDTQSPLDRRPTALANSLRVVELCSRSRSNSRSADKRFIKASVPQFELQKQCGVGAHALTAYEG
ncbi:hypothetical protein EYF80_003379 [Liparis tanakae]|uniref:Uncharacterized protein n=1 Tax=Liparis tanakae TaxID=230148 RepID=A0A4Z2J915_9TELE|nr:hypothetical protein EYF80_003379 [Liparis tanakae]